MHYWVLDSVYLANKQPNKSVKHFLGIFTNFVDLLGSLQFPQSSEWPVEMRSLGGCYSCCCERRCWKSQTSLDFILGADPSLYLHCWATHTVADLYKKSGSDGRGRILLLQVHLAPDPTEGEALTWIIFRQKSINIVCNTDILLFLAVGFGTSLHWHVLYAAIFRFYFGNNESNQKPSKTWPSSPTIPPINPPSGPVLLLQPRRSCSVFPEPDQWL